MPAQIQVMNWNIQNFGRSKSGQVHQNADIIDSIAKIVTDHGPDIFVMLEMNTRNNGDANMLAFTMAEHLNEKAGGDLYKKCVLSPNTGLEFYAFFIRDHTITIPVTLAAGFPETLSQYNDIEAQEFCEVQFADNNIEIVQTVFPLISPDIPNQATRTRTRPIPDWGTYRMPAYGLFRIAAPNVTAGMEYLPIIPCHYKANQNAAIQQFKMLPAFKALKYTCAANGVNSLTLQICPQPGQPAQPVQINYMVLTGDFNVNYGGPTDYDYEAIQDYGKLSATAANPPEQDTHLVTFRTYMDNRSKYRVDTLAVNNYDNFFISSSNRAQATVTATDTYVVNVPRIIFERQIVLRDCIAFYREDGKRGIVNIDEFGFDIIHNYADQLANPESNYLTVQATLLGARIISDHLPVVTTLNI